MWMKRVWIGELQTSEDMYFSYIITRHRGSTNTKGSAGLHVKKKIYILQNWQWLINIICMTAQYGFSPIR